MLVDPSLIPIAIRLGQSFAFNTVVFTLRSHLPINCSLLRDMDVLIGNRSILHFDITNGESKQLVIVKTMF